MFLRDPAGRFVGSAYTPAQIKNSLAQSLRRLGTDYIDLYQPARVPQDIPIEDVTGTLEDLVREGWIRHIGLSEAGVDALHRANGIHPVTAIQMEYSLISRSIERNILAGCQAIGAGVTAYGVLSRGLLSGCFRPDSH